MKNGVKLFIEKSKNKLKKNIVDQKYSWRRGGNATNNCTVLKQLGTNCEFYGTLRLDYTNTSVLK